MQATYATARSLTRSECAAGDVCQTAEPVRTDHIIRDMRPPRSLDATEGLRGGVWLPTRSDTVTFNVGELLGRHYGPSAERFLGELKTLGRELGIACTTLAAGKK